MKCRRCAGDRSKRDDDLNGCLCGNADFEIGGIFAAHSLALHAIDGREPIADIELATARTLERIDEAKRQIDARMRRVRAAALARRPS